MHILHLIKTSQGATWAIALLKKIKAYDSSITFSAIIPPGGKHFDEYKEICRNVYEFEYKIDSNLLSRGKKLKQFVLQDQPDIVHSWFTQTTLYERLFLRGIKVPKIYQVVGPAHLENKLFRWGDIYSGTKNNYWVGCSQYICDKYLNSGVKPERVFLNYAYIELDKLQASFETIKPCDYRSEYNIPDDAVILGTASYIYPPKFYEKVGIKGHEILIEAFSIFLEKHPNSYLIIAGNTFGDDLRYEKRLKQLAQEKGQGKVIFTGYYSNVYEVINQMDVFVYLSRSENLGGVFESLLFEIPTVSSDRGALTELVQDGRTGFIAEIDNVHHVVATIEKCLSETNEAMRTAGKNLVLSLFNQEKIILTAIDIYYQVVKK